MGAVLTRRGAIGARRQGRRPGRPPDELSHSAKIPSPPRRTSGPIELAGDSAGRGVHTMCTRPADTGHHGNALDGPHGPSPQITGHSTDTSTPAGRPGPVFESSAWRLAADRGVRRRVGRVRGQPGSRRRRVVRTRFWGDSRFPGAARGRVEHIPDGATGRRRHHRRKSRTRNWPARAHRPARTGCPPRARMQCCRATRPTLRCSRTVGRTLRRPVSVRQRAHR